MSDVPAGDRLYFVHSYRATPSEENKDWVLATCEYGGEFIAAVQKGDVMACQFHPEKSGEKGLSIFKNFLEGNTDERGVGGKTVPDADRGLAKRVIACLDVRSNDRGDLVVTKGDSYDVRDADDGGDVRNLGKPVELAGKYFKQGADEVAFLNITGYRDLPLTDAPMLEVLRRSSETVFVPLTVGGGIRDFTDSNGKSYTVSLFLFIYVWAIELTACFFNRRSKSPPRILKPEPTKLASAPMPCTSLSGTTPRIRRRTGARASSRSARGTECRRWW